MDKTESLNHTKWDCKYRVVFIPKGRRKGLYGQLRMHLGVVFRELGNWEIVGSWGQTPIFTISDEDHPPSRPPLRGRQGSERERTGVRVQSTSQKPDTSPPCLGWTACLHAPTPIQPRPCSTSQPLQASAT